MEAEGGEKGMRGQFAESVYRITKTIPKGKAASYGWIGLQLGSRRLARAVGNVLHANRSADVPCHRVVNCRGRLAEKFGQGGWREQKSRLVGEGVKFAGIKQVDRSWMIG